MSQPANYESPPRLALATMRPETRAVWRTRYLNDDGQELRAMAVLEKAEAKLRAEGREVTIRTLWMALADKCVDVDDPDLRAAAALAGMAAGMTS